MVTAQVGQAKATTVARQNAKRQAKLTVFHKALEIAKTETIKAGESKVVFAGPLRSKKAEIFLLKVDNKLTLNLTLDGKTFAPLLITEMVNDNDYLAWNAKITAELDGPQEAPLQPTRQPRPNKIANAKEVSRKAKAHDVTPLDHDTFRVKSSSSGQEYLVRLQGNEGGTCDCKWGQTRRYMDNYQSGCSHVQAVYQQLEGQRNRTTSAWSTKEDAKRQKRQMADIGDGVILTLRKKLARTIQP